MKTLRTQQAELGRQEAELTRLRQASRAQANGQSLQQQKEETERKEHMVLLEQLSVTKASLQEKERQLLQLQSRLKQLEQRQAAGSQQSDQARKLLEAREGEIKQHQRQLETLNAQVAAITLQYNHAQQEAASSTQALKAREEELKTLRQQVAQLTSKVNAEQQQQQAGEKLRVSLSAELQGKNQALASNNQALKEMTESLREQKQLSSQLSSNRSVVQQQLLGAEKQRQQLENDLLKKSQALTDLMKETKENARVAQAQSAELQTAKASLAEMKLRIEKQTTQIAQGEKNLELKAGEMSALVNTLDTLKKQMKETSLGAPDSALRQQAYAVGTSLGRDVLKLFQERQSQGADLELRWVQEGVVDALNNTYRLDEKGRNKALFDSSVRVQQTLKVQKAKAEAAGKQFVKTFRQQQGVQTLGDGMWYRIEYAGQGDIGENDEVSVIMKESLPDGTVVSDMETIGKVVTQPLKDYPPVFKAALQKLQNHGSLVLLLPPEKAYGDRGLPPKVPPGSTMVYNIRIVDAAASRPQEEH
ncbi:FKBP-type peptidyl-prolyl cis-trans isomerase N-terminal domain-containing protein [Serratia sp. OS31]|uniref:FKBP-type peptidyl-prolyl cis-trans isomerase N-terminal domain-containing protein n=1 Tax=Serratia sp. OS31 TaxID=2760844 RepID=UPI0016007247|nr:FKBP-type peptidyl-prolyl cis-trans isomerase N-terminal domain-containing protein [Serratia sp. OS31]MBB1585002.1 FKBP-type peptidyl-prolyl cis-trans isomerase [Serratia sp. OS31]